MLRTSLGVLAPSLMDHFSLSGPEFSLLGSLFYYGYAGMQIPAGILLDHFGPQRILPLFLCVCVLGFCLFSFTSSYEVALLGRFLTGLGGSGAFIGTVKATHDLFAEKKFKNLIGLSVSVGLLGAIYGGLPIGVLLDHFGLVPVLEGISYVGLGSCLFLVLLFPNPKMGKYFIHSSLEAEKNECSTSLLDGFQSIFSNGPLLGLIASTGGMSILLYVFADQWGPLYLIQYHGISMDVASSAVSFIYAGMMIGATGLSLIATRFHAHKLIVGLGGFIIPVIVLATLVCPSLPLWALVPMMLLFGLCASLQIIFFSMVIDFLPKKFIGMAIGFSNMTIMMLGSAAINLSGIFIDFFKPETLLPASTSLGDGLYYPPAAYQLMLGVISIISLLCVLGFIMSVHSLKKRNLSKTLSRRNAI